MSDQESISSSVTLKQRLIDPLLDKTITDAVFQEQDGKLDAETLIANIELKDAVLEELDVEAALEFAALSRSGEGWWLSIKKWGTTNFQVE